jgi:hypothetical protein
LVEESGDADARTSTRLMLELVPPTDLDGVLTALAKRDLFLGRWLAFMQRLSAGGHADCGRSGAAP